MRANRRSLYFDFIGEGHAEELRIVYHEPLDRHINLLIGVFAATTLDANPLCGKLVISNKRLSYEAAERYLSARNLIIVDAHQSITTEELTPDTFINNTIT